MKTRSVRALAGLVAALGVHLGPVCIAQTADEPRTILLAFDGLDHAITAELLNRGLLPNLARLGELHRLETVHPAQSPATWASCNTSCNAGRTGVPGFVSRTFMRDHEGERQGIPLPQPMLGFPTRRPYERDGVTYDAPYEINPAQGTPWWRALDAEGRRFLGLQLASTFPPDGEGPRTRLLPGLSLKDISGSPGSWAVYTDSPWQWPHVTDTAGQIVKFDGLRDDSLTADLVGPEDWVTLTRYEATLDDLDDVLASTALTDEERREVEERRDRTMLEFNRFRKEQADVSVPFELIPDRTAGHAELAIQGTRLALTVGTWSDLVPVTFGLGEGFESHGIVRFLLMSCDDEEVRLFSAPVQHDPRRPPEWLPLSAPPEFSTQLAEGLGGPFDTLGWAAMTNPLKDHEESGFEAQAFLEHAALLLEQREAMLAWALAQDDWDVLFQIFATTDRVSHVFFRERDTLHPAHDAAYAATRVNVWGREFALAEAIDEIYREADRVVGRVLDQVEAGRFGPDCTLLVFSDHGFQSYRWGVNLNNLLVESGHLVLRNGQSIEQVLAGGRTDLLLYADWSKTRAYSMGLGKIYVNLEGREPLGIVAPGDYDALLLELREALLPATHGPDGPPVIASIHRRDELFDGPYWREGEATRVVRGVTETYDGDGFADLFVGFAPGYRVAWNNTIGGLDQEPVVVNTKHWSGGHVSADPATVPGVLFSNRALAPDVVASLLDIGPTTLAHQQVDGTTLDLEGKVLPLAPAER